MDIVPTHDRANICHAGDWWTVCVQTLQAEHSSPSAANTTYDRARWSSSVSHEADCQLTVCSGKLCVDACRGACAQLIQSLKLIANCDDCHEATCPKSDELAKPTRSTTTIPKWIRNGKCSFIFRPDVDCHFTLNPRTYLIKASSGFGVWCFMSEASVTYGIRHVSTATAGRGGTWREQKPWKNVQRVERVTYSPPWECFLFLFRRMTNIVVSTKVIVN